MSKIVLVALALSTPTTMGKECIPHDSYYFQPTDPCLTGSSNGHYMNNFITRYLSDANEKEKILDIFGPIETWCFNITDERIRYNKVALDFTAAFQGHKDFNADISKWNISGPVKANGMFDGCSSFNQDIGGWNIALHGAENMFRNAVSFNQDLDGWQTSGCCFRETFRGATAFNGNISHWNVSKSPYNPSSRPNFDMMFRGATSFQGDLSNWKIPSGSTLDGIFMDTNYSGDAPFCEPDCLARTKSIDEECIIVRNWLYPQAVIDAKKASVIVPKIFAFLSILCSMYIIKGLIGTVAARRATKKRCFQRMLLGLSVFDIISSFGYFFTDWAAPENPVDVYRSDFVIGHGDNRCENRYQYKIDIPYAAGNVHTCTAQGFLVQVGVIGSVLFTALLSVSCLLTVKYNWREHKLRKFELATVPPIVLLAVGSAIYLAVGEYFNPTPTGFCWIYPYPINFMFNPTWCSDCKNSITGVSCMNEDAYRGTENVDLMQLVFGQIWIGIAVVTILVTNSMVFCYVRGLGLRNRQYGQSQYKSQLEDSSSRNMSSRSVKDRALQAADSVRTALSDQEKTVLRKTFQYTGVLFLIYTPTIVAQVIEVDWDYIELVINILLTSQGIFNALIYGSTVQNLCCCCPVSCVKSCRTIFCNKKNERSPGRVPPSPDAEDDDDHEASIMFSSKMLKGVDESKEVAPFKAASKEEEISKEDHHPSSQDKQPKTTENCFAENVPADLALWSSTSAKEA